MLSRTAGKPVSLTETQQIARDAGRLALRRVWLPQLLYEGLPWFYLLAGCAAFLTTLYIREWYWVVPHYLVFSAACVHLGVIVLRHRRERRRAQRDTVERHS